MQSRNRLMLGVGTICLLLSAGLNVALAVRVSQQRDALENGDSQSQALLGRRIEPFDARDSFDRAVRVDLQAEDRPTILYAFRSGCAWCERNHEAVLALHAQLADRYRFIGLSLGEESPATFLARFPLPFDVLSGVDKNFLETYELGGTPRTLVLDAQGTVEASYFGAYISGTRRSMIARFNVDLPTVREND